MAKRFEIQIADRQKLLKLDKARLRRIAKSVFAHEGVTGGELSIALVDDAQIHEINRDYLGHDYATDVISFLLEAEPDSPLDLNGRRGAGRNISGEVVLSTETAIKLSRKYKWNPADECVLYLIHGMLHLCGYDDLSRAEKRLMRTREKEMLGLWNLVPHYA